METPLLQTKLYIPPTRPELVSRPHLIERLNEGLHRKLILVSAPAGFGKTTIVSDWVHQSGVPVAWLSLDEGDNDPTRFLAHFVAALQTIVTNVGEGALGALQSPQPPPIESVLTPLINEISEIPDHFALVLDDYHVIESPPVDQALTFFLDHLPPPPGGMHLVIASRTDPSLSLSRLRAAGQMTELRADDLRFSLDEVATFLNQVMDLSLSPENVVALETRTEGWIAGLQLAALSMQEREAERITDFINSFTGSNRYILDYLADEVLRQRPKGTREFLLQTSILDRLTAPLCNALIGSPALGGERLGAGSSQSILEALEAANLFIVPLDDERRWYRYHHLFADLLRSRLEVSQPDLVSTLHRRASTWYAQNDLMSEAIGHSLAARDFEHAAELIEQIWRSQSAGGVYYTVILGWLEALPDEIHRARPYLGVVHGWMLSLTEQLDAVEPRLQELERMTDDQLPVDISLQIASLRALNAYRQGHVAQSIEFSHQVLEALGPNPSDENPEAYVGIAINLGHSYRMIGEVAEAQWWFSELLKISQASDRTMLSVIATAGLAQAQVIKGELHQAAASYRQGLQLADKVVRDTMQAVPLAAYAHLGLGDLLREWNRLDEATSHLVQGLELSQQYHIVQNICIGYLYQARLFQAKGDMDGALKAIQQAEQLPPSYQKAASRLFAPVAAIRAQIMLAQAVLASGDTGPTRRRMLNTLEQVEQWVQARGLSADGSVVTLNEEFEYLVWVRLLIAQNQPTQALRLLERLQDAAEQRGRTGRVIEMLVLQALAQQALGDTEQALATIERALSPAEPEGYIRLFVDEGRPMAMLLCQAVSRDITPDYVSKLLTVWGAEEQERPLSPPSPVTRAKPPVKTAPQLIEPLSERELEVLRLMSAGLTNQQIAETLVVALGTAKAHTASIYAKLDVHNRTQAVARARELDLL